MTGDEAPHYLSDVLVREVIEALLAKADKRAAVDRTRKPSVRIASESTPEWFTTSDGSVKEFSWRRLHDLAKDGLIEIVLPPGKRFLPAPWMHAPMIRLLPNGEERVRRWLERPFPTMGAGILWRNAVSARLELPQELRHAVSQRPLQIGERPATEVLERLLSAEKDCQPNTARRVVAARMFWGLSKVLDSRDDLLGVLGEVPSTWRKPPLLVHVDAQVEHPEGLLFVENWEAFDSVCQGILPRPANWWILFAAGFKTSSERLLIVQNVRWFCCAGRTQLGQEQLQAGVERARLGECAVAFWGDLDFAGLGILRELRRVLPNAVAWTPGYERLLARLIAGDGHTPEESGKAGQLDPALTGCTYADDTLLPSIRRCMRFVDQEAICYPADWGAR